jgi:GNAT superfamily N-acetyltransferase
MAEEIRWPRGFSGRPATLADIPAAVDLFNAWSLLQLGVKEYDEEGLRLEWGVPGFNPATDTRLVFSQDGTLVGYGEMWNTDAPYVRAYTWGRVHPDHLGRGIGSALLRWEEGRERDDR